VAVHRAHAYVAGQLAVDRRIKLHADSADCGRLTMPRGLGQMQRFLLAALKPAKLAYASGKFDYVGGAGSENSKAKGWSRDRELMPVSQLLVNKGGEYWALDPKVYDLRCTLRYLAIHWPKRKDDYPACWQKWWEDANLRIL
jgi:hypothetical protein